MTSRERKTAEQLEAQGRHLESAQLYIRAGDLHDAGRVLMLGGHYLDAGRVLQRAIRSELKPSALSEEERKFATTAGLAFAKAGANDEAVKMFLAVGDRVRAAAILEKAGDHLAAARVRDGREAATRSQQHVAGLNDESTATKLLKNGNFEEAHLAFLRERNYRGAGRALFALERYVDAARAFEEGRHYYEAAQCLAKVKRLDDALDLSLKTATADANYRKTAVLVIKLAAATHRFDLRIDGFLQTFLQGALRDKEEIEASLMLADIYEKEGLFEAAVKRLREVRTADPAYPDITIRLRSLESRAASSPDAKAGGSKLPSLPPLPNAPAVTPAKPAVSAETAYAKRPEPAPELVSSPAPSIAAPAQEPSVGALVSDRYRLVREIGRGGMGAVFEAEDLELSEPIALKFYLTEQVNADAAERFKRELALSRRLQHPNIVQVFDIGTWGGRKYMSMELLSGSDLGNMLKSGPLDVRAACGLLRQMAAGLAAAHAHQIVHRDVKPDNFFVTKEGVVKVMDFGIAKKVAAKGLTQTGMIAGTPHYIAPEQITNFAGVDHRADIYALGVIAYQMFTGQVPFDAEDLMPLLFQHLNNEPVRPREHNPLIPQAIEDTILQMMQKKPDDRPQRAADLEQWFASHA